MAKVRRPETTDRTEDREAFVSRMADQVQRTPPTDPPLAVFPRQTAERIARSVWRHNHDQEG